MELDSAGVVPDTKPPPLTVPFRQWRLVRDNGACELLDLMH